MIQRLIASGHAYVGSDGVVYYDVYSFPRYGQLSGNSLDKLAAGAGGRVGLNTGKRHPEDFFLWKPDAAHIMRWPSPWGEGYPGWHIECSAMATSILGPSIDIHTGGEDNIFPHHECEIAQSEAATGSRFVQVWMHVRHLKVNGEKMSKSRGTFFTVRDLFTRGYSPLAIRYALIRNRYSEPMNFTFDGLQEAAGNVQTLRDLAEKLQAAAGTAADGATASGAAQTMLDEFERAMDDNLNISTALASVFNWAAELNKKKRLTEAEAAPALAALRRIDHVLGVAFAPLPPLPADRVAQIEALVEERVRARANRDWATSDQLRDRIAQLGGEVRDTPQGSTWRPRLAPVANTNAE
jgi:cysteinyl-tRNA synthetase